MPFWPFSAMSAAPPRFGGDGSQDLKTGGQVHLCLFKFDRCPYCRKVYRAIDALGVSVEYLDIQVDRANRDRLVALTGRQQVPCLTIDGVPMFESDAIITWLRTHVA